MHDQNRHRDLLQVFREVSLRERDDAVITRLGAAHHALAPPIPNGRLDRFHAWTVEAVKRTGGQVVIELGPVGKELGLEIVEHRFGQAEWIGRGLHHQRWHGADDRRLRYILIAMTGEITHHLAAAGRMADVNRILQVEMVSDGLQIVGIMVEVVAVGYLRRTAVSAPIMGDDAITFGEEEQHLRVPIVRAQRPTVAEHDGLSAAPVFVIDVYVSSVFFSSSYIWHEVFSFWLVFSLGRMLTQTTRDNQRFAGDPF